MSRKRSRLLTVGALVAVWPSLTCSGEGVGPADDPLAPFVGVWAATTFEFTPLEAGRVERVELTRFGVTLVMEVRPDGRFTFTQTAPGVEEPGVDRGELRVEPSLARVSLVFDSSREDPLTGSFDFGEELEELTLILPDAEFDFDGNGEAEPARSTIVFVKQAADPSGRAAASLYICFPPKGSNPWYPVPFEGPSWRARR